MFFPAISRALLTELNNSEALLKRIQDYLPPRQGGFAPSYGGILIQ